MLSIARGFLDKINNPKNKVYKYWKLLHEKPKKYYG